MTRKTISSDGYKGQQAMYCIAVSRALKHLESGEPETAIAVCTGAIRIDPRHADAYLARASGHLRQGNCDQAVADCSVAIHLDPDNRTAYTVRATAYLGKRNSAKARADFAKADEL